MSRILTGIQSSGVPHLGNILGAIRPAIEMCNDPKNESFIFIADMHSLTSLKNAAERIHNTNSVAAAWLAFGLNVERTVFYRQSQIPEVTEFNNLLRELIAKPSFSRMVGMPCNCIGN